MRRKSAPSRIELSQKGYDLRQIQVGLTWSKNSATSLFRPIKRLFGGGSFQFDLDLLACLLDKDGKITNLGHTIQKDNRPAPLVNSDVIYFHNLKLADESVIHSGDNRTGEQVVDDEVITVYPARLGQRFHKIVFMALIFDAQSNELDFSKVEGAGIVLRDKRNRVICKLNLNEGIAGSCALTFAEIGRAGPGQWYCQPINEFHQSDSLAELLRPYVSL